MKSVRYILRACIVYWNLDKTVDFKYIFGDFTNINTREKRFLNRSNSGMRLKIVSESERNSQKQKWRKGLDRQPDKEKKYIGAALRGRARAGPRATRPEGRLSGASRPAGFSEPRKGRRERHRDNSSRFPLSVAPRFNIRLPGLLLGYSGLLLLFISLLCNSI